MMDYRVFVINPGSTSTKLAVFDAEREIKTENLNHSVEELKRHHRIIDQLGFRREMIERFIQKSELAPASIGAVVARGGLLHPVASGTFRVNSRMVEDLKHARYGEHASNLGGILARAVADQMGVPAYIVDPVIVDELEDIARISGHPEIERRSVFHALNQKAVAREAARRLGRQYKKVNIVVAHLGGGISVGLHRKGKVVDVNNCLDGEGPFSPERAGTLPAGQLAELCFSGKYKRDEVRRMIKGSGGMAAYLETNSTLEVIRRIDAGDLTARLIYRAMAYQVAKQIMSLFPGACGEIDAVVLTGGIVNDEKYICTWIKEMLGPGVHTIVYPGEAEMKALAAGALRVLRGEEPACEYE